MRCFYTLLVATLFTVGILGSIQPLCSQIFNEVETGLIGVDVSQNRNAWGDFDNDGDLDLLLTGDSNDGQQSYAVTRIYRNDNGNFAPIITALPDLDLSAASWGDYDNDGDLDVLLSGLGPVVRKAAVYRNDNGNFVDIEAPLIGLSRVSLDWGDYDNDGDLDIVMIGLISATEARSSVYRNDSGTFVRLAGVIPDVFLGAVSWVDFDQDADLDIFFTGSGFSEEITALYENDGGEFVQHDFSFTPVVGGPSAWGDFDNDQDLDLIVTGISNAGLFSKIYENLGGSFRDIEANLRNLWGGAVAWGDIDSDGDLDMVLTGSLENNDFGSQVLRNENGLFVPLPNEPLIPVTSTSSSVFGDYDNDGDLDLLLTGNASSDGTIPNTIGSVSRLYQNSSLKKNTRPEPPEQLQARVNWSTVFLQWHRSSDAETPSSGLSYNLRVGSNPGGVVILSPMADVNSGHRKVVAIGNASQNTEWYLRDLPPGTYYWSVQAIDHAFAGSAFAAERLFIVTGIDSELDFALEQNYPNPFNPATTITFEAPESVAVTLAIYNLRGQRVRTLISRELLPGRSHITWDGTDDSNELVAAGVYICKLEGNGLLETRKMILLR